MSEIIFLIHKSANALNDAKLLIENNRNEAAANRLYYSIFYCLQILLIFKNEIPRTHKGILNRFNDVFIKTGIFEKSLSQHVQFLFNLRQESDYDIEEIQEVIIKDALIRTEEVLMVLRQYIENNIA